MTSTLRTLANEDLGTLAENDPLTRGAEFFDINDKSKSFAPISCVMPIARNYPLEL